MTNETPCFQFSEDGCLIIRDFLSSEECDELRKECLEIIENIDPENQKAIFSTNDHEQVGRIATIF